MTNAARIFKALADPTRRQILQELKRGEMAVGDIVECFDMTGPAISRHLTILKAADLVDERREGNRIYYSIQPEDLTRCLNDFLSTVCPTQRILDRKVSKRRSKQK